jgi:hypothetical protein
MKVRTGLTALAFALLVSAALILLTFTVKRCSLGLPAQSSAAKTGVAADTRSAKAKAVRPVRTFMKIDDSLWCATRRLTPDKQAAHE